VKLYVDSWDPTYGTGLDPAESGPVAESSAQLELGVELAADAWRPLAPPPDTRCPPMVLLVDGVRRIDARVWVEEADGTQNPGVAASYAAGVVRCDLRVGHAGLVASHVERGLFTPSPSATDVVAGLARYTLRRTAASDPMQLSAAVQAPLHELEAAVSNQARAGAADADDLLVIDGPLRGRAHLPRALGYVKTHKVQYLPAPQAGVVGALRPGQRTPMFLLGTSWHRYTWYLKLPGPAGAPWAGVVRVEAAADLPRAEAIALADLSAVTLPRFASTPYKDARAPQNLTPIAGLERRLRAMLGDPRLLLRSLASAAAAAAVTSGGSSRDR
jgi:hypothetical protein